MTAVKPRDQDRFLQNPPDAVRLFLIYGPDNGQVTQRCRGLEKTLEAASASGGALIQLLPDDLSSDQARLATEAYSTSLFGGMPIIRVSAPDGRQNIMASLKPLLDTPPEEAFVIVEAGDLKPSSPIRKGFEAAPRAASIACYEASQSDMASLIKRKLSHANLTIDNEALDIMVANLATNRLLAENEIDKLVLYAGDSERITAIDVIAIIGESLDLRFDRLIDNALLGHAEALENDLNRLKSERQSPALLLSQTLRHLILLARLRQDIDQGTSVSGVIEKARPPIFFKRKANVTATLRIWPSRALATARKGIADTLLATRRQPHLDYALTFQALHRVAAMGRRLNRRS